MFSAFSRSVRDSWVSDCAFRRSLVSCRSTSRVDAIQSEGSSLTARCEETTLDSRPARTRRVGTFCAAPRLRATPPPLRGLQESALFQQRLDPGRAAPESRIGLAGFDAVAAGIDPLLQPRGHLRIEGVSGLL